MRKEFTAKFNDKEVTLVSVDITSKMRRESDKYVNKAFQDALENGALLQVQVDKLLESRVSNENEEKEAEKLRNEIKTKEVQLISGRIGDTKLTKLEGRSLALEIAKLRGKFIDLLSSKDGLYNRTAEKISESERVQYFIYATTFNKETNRPFFKTYEDFKDNADTDLVFTATKEFFKNQFGSDYTEDTNLEVRFLKKYGFANEKGQLIDSKGRLVDQDFRLINENGRFINENGEFVDANGNRVDEMGNLVLTTDPEAYKD